ncbi:plasmid pRiA4b ORF-3 family protein [Pengzhenrongella sp.]|jgi:hypothetical protein|uniref:plasmid pRiA4b ORF-3 family protein n=1 Tax=Pengzhenrongella sp. TaxID=2888820 RepID=UPI002F942BBF
MRSRRPEVVTYRVRVDLDDSEPPIWRRVEVASDLRLNDLHTVLQVAMGWTDSHLHEFALGDSRRDPRIERFATAEDLADGDTGVPESEVRLDEVLRNEGDSLMYTYDFGDGWEHTLRLDAVLARPDDAPRARCTDGRRACPPEDCGGIGGYLELLDAARDDVGGLGSMAAERFDVEEVNELFALWTTSAGTPGAIASRGLSGVVPDGPPSSIGVAHLPGPVAELLDRADGPGRLTLLGLITRAGLDAAVLIDTRAAERMVRPFVGLVQHVGEAGVALTAAGYLKPPDVRAVAEVLGVADEWFGALNRENQTYPVLAAREAAQHLGLLRAAKGRLHATRAGMRLADDPVGLWRHIAARLPLGRAPYERDAGLIELLATAAAAVGGAGGFETEVRAGGVEGAMEDLATAESDAVAHAAVMSAIGWTRADGTPLSAQDVGGDARRTTDVLRRLGVFAGRSRAGGVGQPTRDGAAFVRAALGTWP